MDRAPFQSDRWITPAVIIVLIVGVLLALVAVVGAATYLTSIGKDPEPMFAFVGSAVGGLFGAASLVLQMANRKTATKTERNTGLLVNQNQVLVRRQDQLVGAVQEVLYEPVPAEPDQPPMQAAARHQSDDTSYDTSYALPPVPGRPSPVAR